MNSHVSAYLQKALEGESLLREAIHPDCRLMVLFPVRDEPVRRILELLESVADQEGVSADAIEVLCLVNNDENDCSAMYSRSRRANELILNLPVWRNGDALSSMRFSEDVRSRAQALRKRLRAFVIDKSSPGTELRGCNIGRARNRLTAEAVHRFYRNGKTGLLLMTDADAVLSDPLHLHKLLQMQSDHPELLGGSGGIDFLFDPDTEDGRARESIQTRFSRHILEKRWRAISDFILKKRLDLAPPDAAYGAHLFFTTDAAARVGGFRALHRFEDSHFLRDLRRIAARDGRRVSTVPHLRVSTALRESCRTDASFGHRIRDGRTSTVKHPLNGQSIALTEARLHELATEIAGTQEGRAFLRRIEHLPQVLYTHAFLDRGDLLSFK